MKQRTGLRNLSTLNLIEFPTLLCDLLEVRLSCLEVKVGEEEWSTSLIHLYSVRKDT